MSVIDARLAVTAALLCASLATHATAQEVAITPRLRAGDAFRLQVVRTRENSAQPQQNTRSTTPIQVRVLSAGAEGLRLEWEPGASEVADGRLAQNPILGAAGEMTKGLVLRVKLTADGEFDALENEADVSATLQKLVDAITSTMLETIPVDQRAQFQAMLGQVLSPATILGLALRDVQIFFGLHGVTLDAGETVEAEIEQPNPLGGAALQAVFTVTMGSSTSDVVTLTTATIYDAKALMDSMRELLARSGPPIPDAELARLPPMTINDDGQYEFDRALGVMRSIVINRRMSVAGNIRVDGSTIRLTTPPSR